jgi:C1A family cysteine protease
MSLYLVSFLFLITTALCIMDLEIYNELKENAPFELLDYETMKEIFKNYNPGDPEIKRRNRMEDKRIILEKIKEQSEADDFLALENQKSLLPKEFDWRKQRPQCFKPPRAQEDCGSCYIFAAIAAFEARICIVSQGKISTSLSQQDILSCGLNHDKCDGGTMTAAWEYLERSGTCSYDCKPYVSFDGTVPRCKYSCDNPRFDYSKHKAIRKSLKCIFNDIDRIKEEIYLNGPVSTGMDTFEDLEAYRSGYYVHKKGKSTDGHAIAIVGWGHDDILKKDYWILKNSWGAQWGEKGYFKVMTGLYGINDYVCASKPDI